MELYPLSAVQLIVTQLLFKLAPLKAIFLFAAASRYCSLFMMVIDCVRALTLDLKLYTLCAKSITIVLLPHNSGTRGKLLLFL